MKKRIKVITAIMCTLVLLVPVCTFGTDSPENHVSGNIAVDYNPSMNSMGRNTITGYYADEFFTADNAVYSKELAVFSLLTAMAGMTKNASLAEKTGTADGRDGYIYDLLVNKLKFGSYQSDKYDTSLENDEDTVGYAFACKNMDGGNVMAIAIRSGGYGKEWGSNTRVGNDTSSYHHQGFEKAADSVLTDVESYVSQHDVNKIWICGYSRGGAVSNILGKRIVDEELINDTNLYCYTFESPMTTRQPENTRGIFNTLSISDPVPQVLLKQWGFARYGTNMYICSAYSSGDFRKCCRNVEETFKEITGKDYQSNSIVTNENFINAAYALLGSHEKYNAVQPEVEKALEYYMGNGESNISGSFTDKGAAEAMEYIGITGYCKKIWKSDVHMNFTTIFQQHWPEATYAWLREGVTGKDNPIKIVSLMGYSDGISDKFNVLIKNSKGNVVTDILDAGYSENGEMRIVIPNDENYTIEIEAYEDMDFDYRILEYEGEGELTRTVSYYDISLAEGEKITGKLTEGIGKDPAGFNPVTSGGNVPNPEVAQGRELDAVKVTVESEGNGIVTGGGTYADGAKVIMKAHAGDGACFAGWFEGENRISGNEVLAFAAEAGADRNITGRFLSKVEARDATCTTEGNVAYWQCSGCSRYYSDAEGMSEISKDSWIVEALGHSYKTVSAGNGCSYRQCSRCRQRINYAAPSYVRSFKLTKGKRCFTAKWKKQSRSVQKKFSGYRIKYSANPSFTGAKTVYAGKSSKSKKIGKLYSKKKYYVEICTYVKKNGNTFYSNPVKKVVKTK